MINITVCDDQANELKKVQAYLNEYSKVKKTLEIKVFSSSTALLEQPNVMANTDIFLLDIVMPNVSGVELGMHIRALWKDCVIVFLTTSKDYALDAYGLKALDYLVKPVDKQLLFETIDKASRYLDKKEQFYVIQAKNGIVKVKYDDILWVEYKDHVLYFTLKGGVIKSKFYRVAFNLALEELFAHSDFVHPHRAFLVNMHHIKKVTTSDLKMSNAKTVPVSKNKLSETRNTYMRFLLKG